MQSALALSPTRGTFAPLFFQGDLGTGMDAAARGGFHAVELSIRSPDDVDVAQVRARLTSLSLTVSALASGKAYYQDGLSLLAESSGVRQAAYERVSSLVELAARLGAPYLIVGGVRGRFPAGGTTGDAMEMLVDAVARLAEVGERHGVSILLEPINRYETDALNTAQAASEVISRAASDSLGLLLDTFHMNLEETSVAATLVRNIRRLRYVHLADNQRRIPGDGALPFLDWLRVLDALGFDGFVGVEALPVPDDATAAERAGATLGGWLRQVADESTA